MFLELTTTLRLMSRYAVTRKGHPIESAGLV